MHAYYDDIAICKAYRAVLTTRRTTASSKHVETIVRNTSICRSVKAPFSDCVVVLAMGNDNNVKSPTRLMIADGHGKKLDFDISVTIVRCDDLGRYFQTVSSGPGGGSDSLGFCVLKNEGRGRLIGE